MGHRARLRDLPIRGLTIKGLRPLLIVTLLMLAAVIPGTASADPDVKIVDIPLEFKVVNSNNSKFGCTNFDGKQYTVRGSLVAPLPMLNAHTRAVTLYLHGATVNDFQWHFREFRDRGYDFVWELAKRGHTSVTIDLLGYGQSGRPNGKDLCTGSQADVAHQVITALRNGGTIDKGGYDLGGEPGMAFRRVAISGTSLGGLIAKIEAFSFHDIDAYIEHGWNSQPALLPHVFPYFAPFALSCAQGGDGGSGYAYSWPDPEIMKIDAFWQIEPDVWEAVKERIEPDSCGTSDTNGDAIFAPDQQLLVSEIDVPVLIVAGEFDLMVGPTAVTSEIEAQRMTSSPDVTVRHIKNQGHAGQFEVTKDALFEVIEEWLRQRSF